MDGASRPRSATTRIVGIDALRLVASLGVVWMHLALAIRPALASGRFGVPYFIVVATWLATRSARDKGFDSFGALVRARALRTLRPFFVWSVIVGVLRIAKWKLARGAPVHFAPFELALEGTAAAYWFLPFIFVVGSIALALGLWLERHPSHREPFVVGFAIASILTSAGYDAAFVHVLDAVWRRTAEDSPEVSLLTRYWIELPMVFASFAIGLMGGRDATFPRPRSWGLVAVLVCGFLVLLPRVTGPMRHPPSDHLLGLVLVGIAFALPESTLVDRVARLGRHGYFVYLCHVILIWPFIVYAQRCLPAAGTAYLAFATIAVAAIGIGLARLARQVPALRWLVP